MSIRAGSNLTKVKKNNFSAILRTIYHHGPLTRTEVARQLDLTIPTVTTTVKQLLEDGILQENPICETEIALGRKATAIDFVATARYMIGIEWGPYGILACVTDLRGKLLWKKQEKVEKLYKGEKSSTLYEEFLTKTKQLVEELTEDLGVGSKKLLGVGFSTPGMVDSERGLLISSSISLLNWKNKNIQEDLEDLLHIPVQIENHVRARAIGLDMFHRKDRPELYLYYFVQEGVSCCVMMDGEPFGKYGEGTGDIGHTIMELNGPRCICGKKGCLQAFVGARSIREQIKKQRGEENDFILSETSGIADQIIRSGDEELRKIIDTAIQYMGISISNIVNLLNAKLIVVDCALLNRKELREQLNLIIREYHMFREDVEIQTEYVDANLYTGAQGACAVMVKEFLTGRFLS